MSSAAKKGAPVEEPPPEIDVVALLDAERLRRLEDRLADQQRLCNEALTANAELEARAFALERENFETTGAYRKELLARAAEAEALRLEVDEGKAREDKAAAAAAAREAALLASFEVERVLLHERAAALQGELEGLREWQQERAAHRAESEALRAQLAQTEEAHALKVRELHRQLREQREEEEQGGGGGSGGSDDEDAGSGGGQPYEADITRLLQHNRKMGQQMKIIGEENEELQKQMKVLEEERRALARDLKLREEMEREYAKRGSQQAREIKDARSRVASLEQGLEELAATFDKEKAALSQALRAQLAEAATEADGLRRLLRLRTRELGRLRALAQQALLQRSEAEAFLISSIQQAKKEAETEGAAASGDRGGGEPSAAAGGGRAPGGGGGRDVSQLSWAERERVLRLLFARINGHAAAGPSAPPLPQHSLG